MTGSMFPPARESLSQTVTRVVIRSIDYVLDGLFGPFWAVLNRRAAQKHHDRLAEDIKRTAPFLFSRYQAKIVPAERSYPPLMDSAIITMEAENMLLGFVRGRGDIRVDIAPKGLRPVWLDVRDVLDVVGWQSPRKSVIFLHDIADILHAEFANLEQALSKWPEIEHQISNKC